MASHNLNGKRRRLDNAAAALSKPFKSPLRRPTTTVKEETIATENQETASASTEANTLVQGNTQDPLPNPLSTNSLATPPPSRKRTNLGQRVTPARKAIPSDPVILDLQKQQRALQSCLATLRSELDTVQQAFRIESSDRDEELEALIVKWKKVSQDAAEEVFAGAQERISRMGGVKAWRERGKGVDARWEQEEMESWFGNVDVEGVDFDEAEFKIRQAEIRGEMEKKVNVEQADEPEEFTMDMMLKTLNIDLKTIGYDKFNQRWLKE